MLAGEHTPGEVCEVQDGQFLASARRHLEERLHQLRARAERRNDSPAATREELLDTLQSLGRWYPQWRFGQLVWQVASWANAALYDIEDEALRAAGKKHLERLATGVHE